MEQQSYLSLKDVKRCCSCRACEQICPFSCIKMKERDGFFYPEVDAQRCVHCGLCEKVCQFSGNTYLRGGKTFQQELYACWSTDKDLIQTSSSGGFFRVAAGKTIVERGVVFGAAFSDRYSVCIDYAEDMEGCKSFSGSKYVFSDSKDAYKKARIFLEQGRSVLYTGTPCQIAGLYAFLQKDYNNLLTLDFVCHGVPAAKALRAYLLEKESACKGIIAHVSFRYKKDGVNPHIKIDFDNEKSYEKVLSSDPFGILFGSNTAMMPTCSSCPYTNLERQSDITMGDFWGIEDHHPEAHNPNGTSLVLINTQKGKDFFDGIKDQLMVHSASFEALRSNLPLFIPSGYNPLARLFIRKLDTLGFNKAYSRYVYWGNKFIIPYRLAREIKNILLQKQKAARADKE